ncbi:MAG: magnesium transporter, partial [Candidatus Hydrothermia bacterium]
LLRAQPDTALSEIMESPVPTIRADEPAEEAARLLGKYNLLALPVVNNNGELLGVITADDVIDIQTAEATEDFHRLVAIASPEERYFNLSLWGKMWRRIPWLVALLAAEILSGFVIQGFELVLGSVLALSYFIPMLTDTGGNMGSQSATLIVRALATGEARARDFIKLLVAEFFVALGIALILGATAFLIAFLRVHNIRVPLTLGIALSATVISADIVGFILPFVGKYALRLDPAVISAPLITTVADVVGLSIYFAIAKLICL